MAQTTVPERKIIMEIAKVQIASAACDWAASNLEGGLCGGHEGWVLGSRHMAEGQRGIQEAIEAYFAHKSAQHMDLLRRIPPTTDKNIKRLEKILKARRRRNDMWLANLESGGLINRRSSDSPIITTNSLRTITPIFDVDHKTGKVKNYLKESADVIRGRNKDIRDAEDCLTSLSKALQRQL